MDTSDEQPLPKRRRRDRARTERALLDAALRLLRRNGVLAGLNLADVADEADVNRGQIYQYFGSRQGLLRAAIERHDWASHEIFRSGRALPFPRRRLEVFRDSIQASERFKLLALAVLDGDEDVRVFPHFETHAAADLARDLEDGTLTEQDDPVALHVLTAASYLGYGIFREQIAREIGVPTAELDTRIEKGMARLLSALEK